jgi:hypothetical protein
MPELPPTIGVEQKPSSVPPQTESLAIASLVLSLLGWVGLVFLAWIPAIICGHIARFKLANTANLRGRGMAIAGLSVAYTGMSILLDRGRAAGGWLIFDRRIRRR